MLGSPYDQFANKTLSKKYILNAVKYNLTEFTTKSTGIPLVDVCMRQDSMCLQMETVDSHYMDSIYSERFVWQHIFKDVPSLSFHCLISVMGACLPST